VVEVINNLNHSRSESDKASPLCFFSYGWFESLFHFEPSLVLDYLPPFVKKFWSPPLVAWKYVKTYGQEFFNYGALGRFVRASQVTKIIHSGCACSRNSSFSFALYWCDARKVCGPSNANIKFYVCYCVVHGNGSFTMYVEGCCESSFCKAVSDVGSTCSGDRTAKIICCRIGLCLKVMREH